LKIENRQKLVRLSLKKSRKSLEATATLLRDGFSESAVSRAYYAAFYLAQAALATKDISRNKHSGVIAAFGESLTKKSILPENLHKLLINLYELRITSDYSIEDEPSAQEAKEAFEAAKEFAKVVEAYLESWLTKGSE
jgi:uncharacterized protein (UPF0332 family)